MYKIYLGVCKTKRCLEYVLLTYSQPQCQIYVYWHIHTRQIHVGWRDVSGVKIKKQNPIYMFDQDEPRKKNRENGPDAGTERAQKEK